jgi:hypothetical protein
VEDWIEYSGWNEANRINVQSLFTWAVLILAFLTSMLGVLSFVHSGLFVWVRVTYLSMYSVLLVGLLACLYRAIETLRLVRLWRDKFRSRPHVDEELKGTLKSSKYENFLLEPWVLPFVSEAIAVLSFVLFFAKLASY